MDEITSSFILSAHEILYLSQKICGSDSVHMMRILFSLLDPFRVISQADISEEEEIEMAKESLVCKNVLHQMDAEYKLDSVFYFIIKNMGAPSEIYQIMMQSQPQTQAQSNGQLPTLNLVLLKTDTCYILLQRYLWILDGYRINLYQNIEAAIEGISSGMYLLDENENDGNCDQIQNELYLCRIILGDGEKIEKKNELKIDLVTEMDQSNIKKLILDAIGINWDTVSTQKC